jgi:hypothetical protein
MSEHVRDVLAEKAKKELAAAGQPRRNVFISFASEDMAEINLLRGQALNDRSDLEFSDRSVKEPFPERTEVIEQGIRDKIRQASVTVVYVTEHSASSAWVDFEIRETIAMGKGVVCMYQGERPASVLPAAVREHHIQVVPWKHAELMRAIEHAATRGAPPKRK